MSEYILISYRANGERCMRGCVVGQWNSDCNIMECDTKEQLAEKIKFIKGLDIDGGYQVAVIQGEELIRDFGDIE